MNAARASGASRSAVSSARGVTQCVIPSSPSYSGATKLGMPPLSTSPSTTDACELRCATILAPSGASARHSAWLPWVAPLVRKNVRSAPYASAASRSARSYGVGDGPRSIPWMSCGMSMARRRRRSPCAARDRRPARPCGPGRGSAPGRGTRTPRPRRGTARSAARWRPWPRSLSGSVRASASATSAM